MQKTWEKETKDFIYVCYIDSGHISYFRYSILPFACHSGL